MLGACSEPFLGDLQNDMSFYVLDDQDYEALISQGAEMTFYNFRIENPENLEASEDFIRSLSRQDENGNYLVGTSVVRPEDSEGAYIRITYSLCLFLFVTIILAAGSILFLKAGNDAREDRERYQVLEKAGDSGTYPAKVPGMGNPVYLLLSRGADGGQLLVFPAGTVQCHAGRKPDMGQYVQRLVYPGSLCSYLPAFGEKLLENGYCPEVIGLVFPEST